MHKICKGVHRALQLTMAFHICFDTVSFTHLISMPILRKYLSSQFKITISFLFLMNKILVKISLRSQYQKLLFCFSDNMQRGGYCLFLFSLAFVCFYETKVRKVCFSNKEKFTFMKQTSSKVKTCWLRSKVLTLWSIVVSYPGFLISYLFSF